MLFSGISDPCRMKKHVFFWKMARGGFDNQLAVSLRAFAGASSGYTHSTAHLSLTLRLSISLSRSRSPTATPIHRLLTPCFAYQQSATSYSLSACVRAPRSKHDSCLAALTEPAVSPASSYARVGRSLLLVHQPRSSPVLAPTRTPRCSIRNTPCPRGSHATR